jgi:hypothetical protein
MLILGDIRRKRRQFSPFPCIFIHRTEKDEGSNPTATGSSTRKLHLTNIHPIVEGLPTVTNQRRSNLERARSSWMCPRFAKVAFLQELWKKVSAASEHSH